MSAPVLNQHNEVEQLKSTFSPSQFGVEIQNDSVRHFARGSCTDIPWIVRESFGWLIQFLRESYPISPQSFLICPA